MRAEITKQKETQQETMSKEKRVVFFEGKSWYHRTKELQDDLTTKYRKKMMKRRKKQRKVTGNMKRDTRRRQRNLQIAKMQKTGCDAWGLSGILV